jgi:aerobic carbon-monoxide dehydrogenase medium subunit
MRTMYPASFEYHRPSSMDELFDLMNTLDGDFKILAGGQSLVPLMKLRLFETPALIDITRIDQLKFVRFERVEDKTLRIEGPILRIGALATHQEISESQIIKDKVPILAKAAKNIGDTQIRTLGTIGGSICHADPAGDYFPALLVSNATVVLNSRNHGRRVLPIDNFVTGPLATAIENSEVLEEIRVSPYCGSCMLEKFARRKSDFALANIAMILGRDENPSEHTASDLRVALGPLETGARRLLELEEAIRVMDSYSEDIANTAIENSLREGCVDFPSDLHGSSLYRREVAKGMVKRMLKTLYGTDTDVH